MDGWIRCLFKSRGVCCCECVALSVLLFSVSTHQRVRIHRRHTDQTRPDTHSLIGKVGVGNMEHSIISTSHMPTRQDNKTRSEKSSLQTDTDNELPAHLLEKAHLQAKTLDGMDLRQIFTSRVMPVAFALPWVASMLISWIPFTKIGFSDAPDFL